MARPKLTSPLTATPKRDLPRRRRAWLIGAAAVSLVGVGVWVVLNREGGATAPGDSPTSVGLPDTPDYHSLLVDPADSERVTLGTHAGLFRTADGGRTWRAAELSGQDAMNLVRTKGPLWTAGHDVLARSDDDGATWRAVRPRGLPSLDVHGFAAHPGSGELFAAVAGQGLYRSNDDGQTFTRASRDVGGSVFGLAVMPDGTLLAADTSQGLLASADSGRSWRRLIGEPILGVAINPADPQTVLATGKGIYRSADAGTTWTQTVEITEGAGPVAWSPSAPTIAYVVGFDRVLYRTDDAGTNWTRQTGAGEPTR